MTPVALALAAALLVPTDAADGPRAPGLALRLGTPLARVDSLHQYRVEPAPAPGTALRTGDGRFFGMPAALRLVFTDARLERIEATVDTPSPRDLDYLKDEMRRLGFARACQQEDTAAVRCTYRGRAVAKVDVTRARLRAVIEAAPAPPPPPAALPPPAPAAPDTLDAAAGASPALRERCDALQTARGRGVSTVVVGVSALVDTSGAVLEARSQDTDGWRAFARSSDAAFEAVAGPAAPARALNRFERAALRCALRTRFAPPSAAGRPVRCWVRFDVRVPTTVKE